MVLCVKCGIKSLTHSTLKESCAQTDFVELLDFSGLLWTLVVFFSLVRLTSVSCLHCELLLPECLHMSCCRVVFHSTLPQDHEPPAVNQQGDIYGDSWLRSSGCGIYVFVSICEWSFMSCCCFECKFNYRFHAMSVN